MATVPQQQATVAPSSFHSPMSKLRVQTEAARHCVLKETSRKQVQDSSCGYNTEQARTRAASSNHLRPVGHNSHTGTSREMLEDGWDEVWCNIATWVLSTEAGQEVQT